MSADDRRRAARVPPEHTPWTPLALLRPGQEVRVVNLSQGGALLESYARMLPGTRAELQLSGLRRQSIRGRIDRCRVVALDPVRYHGAVVFEETLDWRKREKAHEKERE